MEFRSRVCDGLQSKLRREWESGGDFGFATLICEATNYGGCLPHCLLRPCQMEPQRFVQKQALAGSPAACHSIPDRAEKEQDQPQPGIDSVRCKAPPTELQKPATPLKLCSFAASLPAPQPGNRSRRLIAQCFLRGSHITSQRSYLLQYL